VSSDTGGNRPVRRHRYCGGHGKVEVLGLAGFDQEDDDATSAMADLTTLAGNNSDSDLDSEDEADFAAENAPRPPPEEILYGGQGKLRRSTQGGQQPHSGGNRIAMWREQPHITGAQPSKDEPTAGSQRHSIGNATGASTTPQTVLRMTQGSLGNAGPHPGGIGNAKDRIHPCGGNTVGVSTNPRPVVTTSQGDSGNTGPYLGGIGNTCRGALYWSKFGSRGGNAVAAIYVLYWDVRCNEQDYTLHQHGGCNKQ